ncbi:MAG: hypothetical protein H0X07_00120 [Gemmatimonadales bacterium]|nr:hypothetical protein [Gemmatimonadales bacterium]
MHTIYAFTDPRLPDAIRYVGVTKQDIRRRFSHHLCRARRGDDWAVCRWIRKVLDAGIEPKCTIIEVTEDRAREGCWIAYYLAQGHPLLNCAEATGEDVTFTAERRERMSLFQRNRPRKPHSEETKRKLSEHFKGYQHTPERNAKVSAGLKGKKKSAEHKAKVVAAITGQKRSDEARARMSAAAKLRVHGPGKRKTHCHLGHPFSLASSGRQVCKECQRTKARHFYLQSKRAGGEFAPRKDHA